MPDIQISAYLYELQADGRSSPAGRFWADFYELLKLQQHAAATPPPIPLILAASGSSNASKHERLREQLDWASNNDCLIEAMQFLDKLDRDMWNIGTQEDWNRETYWTD